MKVALVTSEVTYVPSNYLGLFEELLERAGHHVSGLFMLKNLSGGLIKQLLGLGLIGCRGVAGALARNIAELPLRKRERLFEQRALPVIRVSTMNDAAVIRWVRDNEIDLIVNLRTRCIYKKAILEAPKLGCINIHHGILPVYRGTLCDLYAMHEGRPAGFTVHVMNEKIDDGRILVLKEVSHPGEKNYIEYLSRTGREEGRVLAELLDRIAQTGTLPEGEANRCEKSVYTRNPDRARIREMREGGMIL